jgi:hypothetical protein
MSTDFTHHRSHDRRTPTSQAEARDVACTNTHDVSAQRVQRSFGHHDVTGMQAFVGGRARSAAIATCAPDQTADIAVIVEETRQTAVTLDRLKEDANALSGDWEN